MTFVAMTAAMVVASPIAGRLADRFGARVVMSAGALLALGGMVAPLSSAWIRASVPAKPSPPRPRR